jgi:serine protease inhibitor
MPQRRTADRPAADPAVSRRTLLMGLAGALVASQAAACGHGRTATPPTGVVPDLLTAQGVARVVPDADAPVGAATDGIVAFGHALARAAATPGKNWVASPLSIATAFAMARVGARGSTAGQLDRLFGYPADGRDGAYNAITRALVTTDVPPPASSAKRPANAPARPPVVVIGNALFTAESLRIAAAFLTTLASQYGAGARPVDFTSPSALAQINAWVKQQTAGRIDQLFAQLDPDTQLVLANTVYLRADWATDFAAQPLIDAPFTVASGARVTASTMHQVASVGYAAADGWQAVELPYAGGDLAMRVMLPAPGGSPDDMLAPSTMAAVDARMSTATVDVTMPRWNFEADIDLGAVLPAMGLTAPFGSQADFGGIAPGLSISQAVHKANITVDQKGTEAAAVTGMAMAGAAPAPRPLSFEANRPFAFAIVGGGSRVPLFVGHVADPSAS